MAFKPFLTEVIFDDDTNVINLTVEHRDDVTGSVIKRVYQIDSGKTANQTKAIILAKNSALNSRPNIINTLTALIGTEIT